MRDFQKVGGVAALVCAATYVVGFGLYLTYLAPTDSFGPDQMVAFLAENQTLMHAWNMTIYVVNGVFLVVLALALHDRLKTDAPGTMQTATVFGLIWAVLIIASGMLILVDLETVVRLYGSDPARAASALVVFSSVEEGLGGGIELVGGLWVLLLSGASLRTGGLSRGLNYLGLLIGVAGVATVLPRLGELGAVFGLGFIPWFLWVGFVLLRGPVARTA